MDSKTSAPEMASLSNSSGASLPSFRSSHDTSIDNSMKGNEFKIDNNETSAVGGGDDGGGSENEGFMSGDEEFEMASDKPVVADPDEEKAFVGDYAKAPVINSSEFSVPTRVPPPIAKPSADDNDDDDNYDDVVGDAEVKDLKMDEAVGNENKKGKGGPGFVDEVVNGDDAGEEKESLEEKSVRESDNSGAFVVEKVELERSELKSGEVVAEKKSGVFDGDQSAKDEGPTGVLDESKLVVGGIEQVGSGDEAAEADGLKFSGEGDVVVGAINVDLTKSGAAVVGDVVESKDFEVKGKKVTDDGSLKLDNGFDQTTNGAEVPVSLKTLVEDAELIKDISPEARDYVEHTEVEPTEGKVEITVSGKDEYVDSGNDVARGLINNEEKPGNKMEPEANYETEENETKLGAAADVVELMSNNKEDGEEREISKAVNSVAESEQTNAATGAKLSEYAEPFVSVDEEKLEDEVLGKSNTADSDNLIVFSNKEHGLETENEEKHYLDEEGEIDGSGTDGETEGMIFESSEAAKQFLEELEQASGRGSHSGAESSHGRSQRIDGQIVTDSEDEAETDEEGEGKELFDSAALAALLKAATGAGSDGGGITITSQDGSKLFSVERPAGLGSTLRAMRPAARANRPNLFSPSSVSTGGDSESNLSEEEKKKLEKLQEIRVKFLRLVRRLGCSPEDSVAAQVLYRLSLVAGRQTGQLFSLDTAKGTALQLEEEGQDLLNFSLNILVIGKTGVGKSATINSIFGEEKVQIHAFESSTTAVKEITGTVDGVKVRVIDTPGLKSSAMEQGANSKILSSVKKFTKKCPPDIVLYVDRLDTQTRDLNDLPLLRTITSSLGSSIWRSAIVTLTHAASAPPDGPSGSPLSYEVFVAQRSHVVQQSIGQAVGDLRLMNPSLMNPVSLVENHPACRKNRDGQKVLPNGQSWRPQLLLLCYSMKILSEASSVSKPQDPFDHKKLFGFRVRSPPLPYLLSWLLQSRTHPKLSTDQGLENDSDVDLADLSDSDDEEEEDEYDLLPPFKPLRKVQIAKLSKEQRKAYFEEYDYRVKLLQKKQWREELKRMREIKKKGKVVEDEYGYAGEDVDQENGSPAAVQVPLPDMVLPPSFDSDNPAYRYRFLEPTSQFLARPVLDTHGWDHDCGYDGVNLENNLAIANRFPTAVVVQVTKDKKEFNIHLDSSISAKHGENGSSMAGFDIQNVGKQLAYILRGETKFKNFKKNKTTAGFSVTFLGENVATGVKVEDQIAIGKRLILVGSTGTVRSQGDAAYGANLEVRLREVDFPIGQDQSSLSLSIVKWRGDLALGANLQSQFSIGRGSKVAVRAGLNNKLSGQISVRTSTSDQFQIALLGILPIAMAIYKSIRPGVGENYSMY